MALRSQLAEQSTTLLDQHPRIKELRAQIAETDRPDPHRGRAAGAPARQRRQGRRRPAGDADRQPRSGQEARLAEQRAGRAIARARARGQDRSAICWNLIWRNIAKRRARDNINAAPPEARIISRATPVDQAGLSEENADRSDRRLGGLRAVGGLHRDRRTAGAGRGAPLVTPMRRARYRRAGLRAAPRWRPPMMPRSGFAAVWRRRQWPHLPRAAVGRHWRRAAIGTDRARIAPVGRCRPPGHCGRQRAQCRHDFCRDFAGARARQRRQCRAGRPCLRRAQSVGDLNRPESARHCRTGARHRVVRRHHHARSIFAVHLVATGNVGSDAAALAASPMLATVIEALARSYDHVVLDAGSAADAAVERFAPLSHARGAGGRRSGQCGNARRARAADAWRVCRRDGARGRGAGGRRLMGSAQTRLNSP